MESEKLREDWFDQLPEVIQRRKYHKKRTKSSFARFNEQAFDIEDELPDLWEELLFPDEWE